MSEPDKPPKREMLPYARLQSIFRLPFANLYGFEALWLRKQDPQILCGLLCLSWSVSDICLQRPAKPDVAQTHITQTVVPVAASGRRLLADLVLGQSLWGQVRSRRWTENL